MSILFENENGYYISHKLYFHKLYETQNWKYNLKSQLFEINVPFKQKKLWRKNTPEKFDENDEDLKAKFFKFIHVLRENDLILIKHNVENNEIAVETAELAYEESGKALIMNAFGSNIDNAKMQQLNNFSFIFPQNCEFFCKDVLDMSMYLKNRLFDLIILDPPWWNKYIRRKRKKSNHGYKMMFNKELEDIPVGKLLEEEGLVVVWCTNSNRNMDELLSEIFPKWGIKLISKWYWMKITQTGQPVCDFSDPPGKQPYEQIIFGSKKTLFKIPDNQKLVVSVPSAIHSHKPPLIKLLKPFLPENPVCLEVFARYLLPNFTSYGNEVLRFQHESLYEKTKNII